MVMLVPIFSKAATLVASLCFQALTFAAPSPVVVEQRDNQKYVFAHFMVGIVPKHTVSDWAMDMAYAQEIGIDAFALNCASVDSYTPTQLANAYAAAQEVGFNVFISFDFSYFYKIDTATITAYMNQYAAHPAQTQYNGGAVVSTFIGDTFDWGPVKAGTSHSLFAIPNMVNPSEPSTLLTGFDGAFSWYAWPTSGNNQPIAGPMTTVWDEQFIGSLRGSPYIWLNWVFVGDTLLTDRWNEILTLKPQLAEIISWNDYGECHYIGPWEANHTDGGSAQWIQGFPHDGWRIITKAYIAAYKCGAAKPTVTQDQLVYWFRPTPKNLVCTSDSVPAPAGIDYLSDSIFVITMLTEPATLSVVSGSNSVVTISVPAGIATSSIPMGIGAQTFSVSRSGSLIMAGTTPKSVASSCTTYNFNAFVGSLNATVNE